MGLYIPNMNLPQEKFARFIISIDSTGMAYVGGKAVGKVAEIKTPHDDLVDACRIIYAFPEWTGERKIDLAIADCLGAVGAAETIIDAEE